MKRNLTLGLTAMAALLASPTGALACAACFGKSDSKMAVSLNAGIFIMLAFVGTMMVGAASFFVFLSRRAAALKNQPDASEISK